MELELSTFMDDWFSFLYFLLNISELLEWRLWHRNPKFEPTLNSDLPVDREFVGVNEKQMVQLLWSAGTMCLTLCGFPSLSSGYINLHDWMKMYFSPTFIRNHKSYILLENESCSRIVVSSKNDSFHFPGSLPCLLHLVMKKSTALAWVECWDI